ncbi:AvrE-family type 3 secretion system effector [Pseudomonas borbori]
MRGIHNLPVQQQQPVNAAQNLGNPPEVQQGRAHRSFGQRVVSLFRRGQQGQQPPQVQQGPQRAAFQAPLTPQVDAAGNLTLNNSLAGEAIEKQLNQPHKEYSQLTPDATGVRVQVKQRNPAPGTDPRARDAVHLQQTPAVIGVLKTSRPALAPMSPNNPQVPLPNGQPAFPPSPGRAHLGQISGVHTGADGVQARLHQGRRQHFDTATQRWQPAADQTPYKALKRQGDGVVHGVQRDAEDLSAIVGESATLHKQGSQAQVRIGGDNLGWSTVTLKQAPAANAAPPQNPTDLDAKRIGYSADGWLYACNGDGELFRGNENSVTLGGTPEQPELPSMAMSKLPLATLEQALGGRAEVEGFMHDDGGQLNALVRDQHEQLHACPIDAQGRPTPAWNLSDALVMTKDEGLAQLDQPPAHAQVDLGPRGKVAVHGGRLHGWNEQTQSWTASNQRVDRLDRGLDGKAYVLQHGELKAVKASNSGETLRRGASHDLTPAGKRTKVELDAPLAGSPERKLSAFAVVDDKHFVALGRDNVLHAHVDGRTTALALPANVGRIESLALDNDKNLYAQSDTGSIHRLDRQHWQKVFPEAVWHNERTADFQLADRSTLRTGADKRPVARFGGQEHRLVEHDGGRQWQALQAQPQQPNLQQRLEGHHSPGKLGGANVTTSSHVLTHTTEGVAHKDRGFGSGLKRHFHPLDAVKQTGLDIQHHFKGREGLRDVYADERALLERLPVLASAPQRMENLDARLAGLNLPEQAQPLRDAMQSLRGDVEKSSQRSAVRLGQLHGIVDDQGVVKEDYRPSLKSRIQSGLNPGGRHRVTSQLHDAFLNASPSAQNPTRTLLHEYREKDLHLSHRGLDQRADKGDRSALVKDQLIFDAHTLSELHALTDELQHMQGQPLDQARLREIGERFETLKQRYESSDIRIFSDANITNHGQLERLYDHRKRLASELGSQNHALNLNTRRALGVAANDVNGALVDNVRRMDAGDSLAMTRTKGTALNTPYISTPLPFLWLGAGVAKENSVGVSLSRTDEGADVQLSGSRSRAGNVLVGAGEFFGQRGGQGFQLGVFAGAELNTTVGRKRESDVSFSVKDGDLERVMGNLSDRDGKLTDLLSLGTEHKATETSKTTLDIDLWAGVEGRAHFGNFTDAPAPNPVTAFMRTSLGPALNASLLHVENSTAVSHGPDGERGKSGGFNAQVLRKGDAGVYFRPVQGVISSNIQSGGQSRAGLLNRTPLELSAKVNLDRSKQRSFNVAFKLPEPVKRETLGEVFKSLRREFPEQRGAAGLAMPAADESVNDQFTRLTAWKNQLADGPRTEGQYGALHDLQQLQHQHTASSEQRRQFSSAERTVSGTSLGNHMPLAKHMRTNGTHGWLNEASRANGAELRELLSSDPRFADLVKGLEEGKGTDASVVLELKDSVRQRIEARCVAGESVDRELREALSNRDNLRIKSISVKRTATQSHGMATPPLILGFTSNASISHSHVQGKIDFKYGHNEDRPLSYSLDGEIAKQGVASDLIRSLHQEERVTMRFVGNQPDLSMADPRHGADPGDLDNRIDHQQNPANRPGGLV